MKVTDARNLPKPVKLALRTRDRVAQTQDELLTWISNVNHDSIQSTGGYWIDNLNRKVGGLSYT
jgi:hypothetical protein